MNTIIKAVKTAGLFAVCLVMTVLISGCSENESSKNDENQVTIGNSFKLRVSPAGTINGSMANKSITQITLPVTSLDITVSQLTPSTVVGTFNWIPADGVKSYDVAITQTGSYRITVLTTASDGVTTKTSTETADVSIEPMKITIVSIVPGGSMTVDVEGTPVTPPPAYAVLPENFDSTAAGHLPVNWNILTSGGDLDTYVGVIDDAAIAPAASYSSPNCLKIADVSPDVTRVAEVSAPVQNDQFGQLMFYAYIPNTNATLAYARIKTATLNAVDLVFGNTGTLEIRNIDGTTRTIIGTYTFNTWCKIEIKWDKNTGLTQIIMDDVSMGVYPLIDSASDIKKITFRAGSDSKTNTMIYIDNVNLTNNTEAISAQ
jgi:hypothetical protein